MKKKLIMFIECLILFALAFTPAGSIFSDDFENHLFDATLRRDYQVWENGAVLNIYLENEIKNSGRNALGVEVVSPNPYNDSEYGSIFRTLELLQGNWSGGEGVRFWISNPNEEPILLSFNLKERYREYWAVAESGVVYLQDEDGVIHQDEIQFSNIIIPPFFQGLTIIPFESLAVPEWNTATSNGILELDQVESYAFSVRAGEASPFLFYIDDFEVFGETSFATLSIEGVTSIQIPDSGEHLAYYNAQLGSLDSQSARKVDVDWAILDPDDVITSINDEGVLRTPADAQAKEIILLATYQAQDFTLTRSETIALQGGSETPAEEAPVSEPDAGEGITVQSAPFDRFSTRFDLWATENRTLFVLLAMGVVVIFLFILSFFERKLKS